MTMTIITSSPHDHHHTTTITINLIVGRSNGISIVIDISKLFTVGFRVDFAPFAPETLDMAIGKDEIAAAFEGEEVLHHSCALLAAWLLHSIEVHSMATTFLLKLLLLQY